MQKRKNSRFKAIDILVILVCLFGVGLSIVLFWKDLNRTLTKLYEEHIATISYKYKAAQRKFVDRVLWDRLKQESPVYNGDIIRTADLSEARVTFLDGQYIELFENTLAQIFWDKKGIVIGFSGGDININSHIGKNAMMLSSGNKRVEIAPGGVLSAKSGGSGDALNVMLREGSGSITSASGETLTLSAGSALNFFKDGILKEDFPVAVMLSPVPGTRVLNNSQSDFNVNFSWKTNNFPDGEFVHLEISKDTSFNKPVYSSDIKNANEARIPLPSGTYWWRIFAASFKDADNYIKNISSGKLNIYYAPALRLITPADKNVFSYRTQLPSVRFLWTNAEQASAYRIDIADNPQMEKPIISKQLFDTAFVSSSLPVGTWYWRVTPLYPADFIGNAFAPVVSSFSINKSGILEAPVLSTPATGTTISISKESKDTYFSWRSDKEADTYTIQISKNKDLSDPIIKREINENWYIYKPGQGLLEEGATYYWGVSQTDTEKNISPLSDIRNFVALKGEVVQKNLFPPDNYDIADARLPDTRFTWKSNLPFTNRFQVSDKSDFSTLVIDEEVVVSSIQGRPLPVGEYYWRVYSESDDKTVTFTSSTKQFTVVPPLPAPFVITPLQNEKVVVRDRIPVEFKWSNVQGANYYQLKLFKAGSSVETLSQYATTNNSSILLDNLPDGDYRWTVQAFIDEGPKSTRRTSLLGIFNFTMKKLNPVYLANPSAGYVYDGLQALRSPGEVKWSTPEEVGETRFILSKNSKPLEDQSLMMDIKNPPKNIQLIPLREGRWYWTIIAETIDGFDISARNPSYFIVSPVPLLPAPGNRIPENRYIIGPAQLKTTKTILFSWNNVEGANAYVITIFHEGEKANQRKLLHTVIVNEAKYELEDLSMLDRGNFIWQVEAISRKEELIEQRGTVGQNSFTINLPQVTKPTAKQQGIFYGK